MDQLPWSDDCPEVLGLRAQAAQSQARSRARRRAVQQAQRQRRLRAGLALLLLVAGSGVALSSARSAAETAVADRPASRPPVPALPPGVPYRQAILRAARQAGVQPALLAALVQTESDFQPAELSPAGAYGLTQLIPEVRASYGVTDPDDIDQQLLAGARLLHDNLQRFGTETLALAAYNAGPGAVSRYGGVPPYPETQAYVRLVLQRRAVFQRQAAHPPADRSA